jgi:hypothetical protein
MRPPKRRARKPDSKGIFPVAALCPICDVPIDEFVLARDGRVEQYASDPFHVVRIDSDDSPPPDVMREASARPQPGSRRPSLFRVPEPPGGSGVITLTSEWVGLCPCGLGFRVSEGQLRSLIRRARAFGDGLFYLPRVRPVPR